MILKIFPKKPIKIARIKNSYGILGWMRLISFTQNHKKVFEYQPWFIHYENQWKLIELEHWKLHKNSLIFKVKNINNRNMSEKIKKHDIIIDENQLPKLNSEEFYWKDLIQCQVYNIKKYNFGIVENLIETGSNEVLYIRNLEKKEYFIPIIRDNIVKKIDILKKIIVVDWYPYY